MEKIDAYLEKGYARKLNTVEAAVPTDVQWFLPHFPTSHPNKPGKIRIVLDAASRSNGVCLNDCFLTGPDLLVSLFGLLLKFRRKKVAIMGDIAEMFHQVRIRKQDCPAQRILWRTDPSKPPDILQIEVMIFGSSSSPYCAQFVKNLNAEEYATQYPAASQAIVSKHYMDDYLDCFDEEDDAIRVAKDVTTVHAHGGFQIGKWASNSPRFLKEVGSTTPAQERDLSKWSEIQTERVLGLHWSPEADAFTFRVNLERAGPGVATGEKTPTKREILRLVMLLWDPLGFFGHHTVKAKILLQRLWGMKLGWDDEIPEELMKTWIKWVQSLPRMRDFKLRRMYSEYFTRSPDVQVHVFADSSEKAYCSVSYVRTKEAEDKYAVSFVMSKCRVAPLKPCSIPRLELQAALLASRMGKFISQELEIPHHNFHYWTDSMTTLRWIRNEARRFNQFVANRVGEIQENSSVADWHWAPSKSNPADFGTRDGTTDMTPSSFWWSGPNFLQLDPADWPQEPTLATEDLPEMKPEFVAVVAEILKPSLPEITRFSSYLRLVRATAYVLKFIELMKSPRAQRNFQLPTKHAEQLLMKRSQWESYATEMKLLTLGENLPLSSSLFQLSPMLDHNGVLRMKSRLAASQDEGTRLPIILHPKDELTKLLILHFHKRLQHQGEDMVKNEMRQSFWIPRLRTAIRSAIRGCGECRLRRVKSIQPMMGDLPEFRIQPQTRPFTIVGVDYFGPMMVTIGRKHDKRYGVLFTCLSTRVHLEVAHSLTTDSCIMAIRRFVGRRGLPKEMHSDNGTNLRGADKELRAALAELDQQQIIDDLCSRGIDWHFLPPASPNMAGVWERLVRSVKTALEVILKTRAPKEEVLLTVFAEAEAIVNSRPLVDVPVDPCSPEALTPFHFLIGTSSTFQPAGEFHEKEADLPKRWRQTQALADMFWRRWTREYLPTLQRRAKWHGSRPNVSIGDIVVVLDESLRRNTWPLGRVTKVFPGKDGVVRVVEVQTAHGVYKRPASKLGILDVKSSLEA